MPVAELGPQWGGVNRPDAWDLRQPAARLTPAVQGHDALVNGCYLGPDSTILPRQYLENAADGRGNPAISATRDDPEQLRRSITALGRYNTELGQGPAQGIAEHRTLAHQQFPGPVQHQAGLLLLRLDRNDPPRRAR